MSKTKEAIVPILLGAVAATYGVVNIRRFILKHDVEINTIINGVFNRLDPGYWAKNSENKN